MNADYEEAIAARDRTRARFRESLAAARLRLRPSALASSGAEAARSAAASAPKKLGDAVKHNPVATAGALAIASIILFRKPIIGALKRWQKEPRND